jgi:hypothetical protein
MFTDLRSVLPGLHPIFPVLFLLAPVQPLLLSEQDPPLLPVVLQRLLAVCVYASSLLMVQVQPWLAKRSPCLCCLLMNPQRLIGTQAFLPATLTYMRDAASPASLPIDQVIFQSVLLCLTAQHKHLIIRTPEEDLGLAVQLAVWTLSSIFDLKTHKVKTRKSQKRSTRSARSATPSSHPRARNKDVTDDTRQLIDDFLRSLFFIR